LEVYLYCLYFVTQLTYLMLVWTIEFFMLADFDETLCSSSLSILATYSLMQFNGRKRTDMMEQYVMCLKYGHCIVKQMYESVLNSVVKVTERLLSFTGHYLAIRIMEDIGLCDGRNVNSYLG